MFEISMLQRRENKGVNGDLSATVHEKQRCWRFQWYGKYETNGVGYINATVERKQTR